MAEQNATTPYQQLQNRSCDPVHQQAVVAVFAHRDGFSTTALRCFNVFGSRQSPHSASAAAIPTWIKALLNQEPVCIQGDGETRHDS